MARVKNPPSNAEDPSLIPGQEDFLERNGSSLQYSCLGSPKWIEELGSMEPRSMGSEKSQM